VPGNTLNSPLPYSSPCLFHITKRR
jgi:hypothetical protein